MPSITVCLLEDYQFYIWMIWTQDIEFAYCTNRTTIALVVPAITGRERIQKVSNHTKKRHNFDDPSPFVIYPHLIFYNSPYRILTAGRSKLVYRFASLPTHITILWTLRRNNNAAMERK